MVEPTADAGLRPYMLAQYQRNDARVENLVDPHLSTPAWGQGYWVSIASVIVLGHIYSVVPVHACSCVVHCIVRVKMEEISTACPTLQNTTSRSFPKVMRFNV